MSLISTQNFSLSTKTARGLSKILPQKIKKTPWLHLAPPDPRGGDPKKAADMVAGFYTFGGCRLEIHGNPFRVSAPSSFEDALHGFEWLRHFSAASQPAVRDHARILVRQWFAHWRYNTLFFKKEEQQGRRLCAWVGNGILLGEDAELRPQLTVSMIKQMRALRSPRHLTASLGLALGALCVPGGAVFLQKALQNLQKALQNEILPDGGHISRNPQKQLSILLDLIHLRDALQGKNLPLPVELARSLERMVPMVRFFLHGDNRLAVFNGGTEGEESAIAAALREESNSRPFGYAPHTRYQRLNARKLLLLVDNGLPPPLQFSQNAHAGCLAFEMSVGKHRVVVNRGERDSEAHATLTVKKTSPGRFFSGFLKWIFGPCLWGGPTRIESRPMQNPEGIWLETAHNGYTRFGLLHRRRLFLAASGEELRGEDSLERVHRKRRTSQYPYKIHFPLHPALRIALSRDHKHVFITLSNKTTWQFRAKIQGEFLPLTVESQVYKGGDLPQKTWQIVLAGTLSSEAQEIRLNWAFSNQGTR